METIWDYLNHLGSWFRHTLEKRRQRRRYREAPQQAVGEPLQRTEATTAPAPPSGFKVGDEIRLADGTVAVVAAPPTETAPPVIPPANPVKPPVTQTAEH